MRANETTIEEATSCFKAGNLAQAKAICSDILRTHPENAEVLHLSGIISAQSRDYDEAADLILQAIRLSPGTGLYYASMGSIFMAAEQAAAALTMYDKAIALTGGSAQVYSNRGNALSAMGQMNEALGSYTKALEIEPGHALAHYNCATILVSLDKLPEALAHYEHAIAGKPDLTDAYINRGFVLSKLNRLPEAWASYTDAITQQPDKAMAYCSRSIISRRLLHFDDAIADCQKAIALDPGYAEAYFNLGLGFKEQGQLKQAISCFDATLERQPGHVAAILEKGIALQNLEHLDAAIENYREALSLDEENVHAHYNLGIALAQIKQTEAAIASFERAIAIKPDYAEAIVNCGNALLELQQADAAITCYKNAIQLQPDMAEAHWNKGLALLAQGQFEEGWQSYEWRWKKPGFMEASLGAGIPLWDVQAEPAKHLYIWAEQGIGDEIMFGGLLPQSLQLAAQVTVHMDSRLVPLFRRSMPNIDIGPKQHIQNPGDFDARLPMASLARIFCNSIPAFESIPSPYLMADKARSQALQTVIRSTSGMPMTPIIGLSWLSKNELTGQDRTIPLSTLIGALDFADEHYVSLQYGDVEEEIAAVKKMLRCDVLHLESANNFNDLDELSALIDACDLVITIDNSTAHLAGALAKPTWLLLPFTANWRWMLKTEKSLWYPTLRIYRQDRMGDWGPVLAQLGRDFKAWSEGKGRKQL